MALNLRFHLEVAKTNFTSGMESVFSKPSYAALAVIAALAFGYSFVYATGLPRQTFESWIYSTTIYTKATGAVVSVLLGMITATQAYVIRNYSFSKVGKRASGSAAGAYLTAILGAACCSPFIAPLLLPLIGLGATAQLIERNQLAFFVVSTLLLLASLYYSAKVIGCEACRVKIGAHAKH